MKIDNLIEIVSRGGTIRTGINIYNKSGTLLLRNNVLVSDVGPLLTIKKHGVLNLDIDPETNGGIWDETKQPLPLTMEAEISTEETASPELKNEELGNVEKRIKHINRIRKEAAKKYGNAKKNIKKVISELKEKDGRFDVQSVEDTVSDIVQFMEVDNTAFSYLTKNIFSHDEYLYNHSVNVCTIGTAILNQFNRHFSSMINNYFASISLADGTPMGEEDKKWYLNYQNSELKDMAIGYFLHDVGKVLVPSEVLDKKGPLTEEEFEIIKTHSFEKGLEVLRKSDITNSIIENILTKHHTPLFMNEKGCYPNHKLPIDIPAYVKVAKLADIYDAMTSKRCYKDAFNPINVVTQVFRTYAGKDPFLQVILHSFVKIVGIYPPGSILTLRSGQLAYVLLSEGPLVLLFTDTHGDPLSKKPDPIDLGDVDLETTPELQVDKRRPLQKPTDVYELLPRYIKELFEAEI
jgi:HD-GYP domain-containing protein (c-di-GMP phosphodiesterase class II)